MSGHQDDHPNCEHRNPTSMIHDLVRGGRVTPEQAAMLLEFRRAVIWRRKPWWVRVVIVLWRAIWSW